VLPADCILGCEKGHAMTDISLAKSYDNAAPEWAGKVARLGYQSAYTRFVRGAMPPLTANSQVCDIGAGCGAFAQAALSIGVKPAGLTLVDPSRQMLEHACRALDGQADNVSCHTTTLEAFRTDQAFDLVLGAHVIEHCQDATYALAKMYDLLAPGGTLLLVISRPHWCQWFIWLRWRHRWYSEIRVRQMAKAAGLPCPKCHRFTAGPPQRTSFGYSFSRPKPKDLTC
jgi:ubiquinone/menaquinone biosynthesis C-methylase UbiE